MENKLGYMCMHTYMHRKITSNIHHFKVINIFTLKHLFTYLSFEHLFTEHGPGSALSTNNSYVNVTSSFSALIDLTDKMRTN